MLTRPNCKINLGLHVVSRRSDGYHNLESLFLPIPLCDELEIEPSSRFSLLLEGIHIGGSAEDNLVVKAYRMLQQEFGSRIGTVSIRLKKNIPFGAGLGGGSSDAAFALSMLNDMFSLRLSQQQLCRYAARLGADCVFFVHNSPAYVTGIGDEIEPLGFNPIANTTLLLLTPAGETVSTAEAYRSMVPRNVRGTASCHLPSAVRRPMQQWRNLVVNDFEPTVFASHPMIGNAKQALYDAGALYAAMSGSGSSVFGIFPAATSHAPLQAALSGYGTVRLFNIGPDSALPSHAPNK